jgi:excisionase family DNA binding protein
MSAADALLGPKDVASRLGVPISWVYSAAEAGTLPSFKIGKYRRFDPREIAAWLEQRRQRPTTERGASR